MFWQAKGLFDDGDDMFGEEDSPGVDIFNKPKAAPKQVHVRNGITSWSFLLYSVFKSLYMYTPSLNKLDLSESKFKHVIYWIFYLRMMSLFPKQNPQEACLMERKMICLVPPRYTVNNFTSSIDSILYIQIEKRLILFWCRFILKHEKFFFITYMYVYWQS